MVSLLFCLLVSLIISSFLSQYPDTYHVYLVPQAGIVRVDLSTIYCSTTLTQLSIQWSNFTAGSASLLAESYHLCVGTIANNNNDCSIISATTTQTNYPVTVPVNRLYYVRVSGINCVGTGPTAVISKNVVPNGKRVLLYPLCLELPFPVDIECLSF